MKTKLFAAALSFLSLYSIAQAQMTSPTETEGPNMIKFNALSLLGGKLSFEYERMLTNRLSAGAAVSLRPSKGLPFATTVKDLIDKEDVSRLVDGFSSSNFSITPEVRFYTTSRGPFRGFYIAPYAKYASYSTTIPFDFEVDVDVAETEL